jgi:hypothetical protein
MEDAYYSSQSMPGSLLGQAGGQLAGMMRQNAESMNSGMDQFYGASGSAFGRGRDDLLGSLGGGASALSGLASSLGQGYRNFADRTGGSVLDRLMPTEAEQVRRGRDAEVLRRQYQDADRAALDSEYEGLVNQYRALDPGNVTYGQLRGMSDAQYAARQARERAAGRARDRANTLSQRAGLGELPPAHGGFNTGFGRRGWY